ncbi:ATP-binding protein [SAR92 clade bacterium H231]|nr:ATP-binding protein [SAR92 clade bacterium H231]
MHLKYCDINNFRSIQDLKVTFDNNFQILVGFNEAGKSNILKALSLINPDILPDEDDIRDPGHDEEPVETAFVRFVFGLEVFETNKIFNNIKPKFKAKSIGCPIFLKGKEELSIEGLCGLKKEGIYKVNILDKSKRGQYWTIYEYEKACSSTGNWKKVPSGWSGYEDFDDSDFQYICVHDYPKYEEDGELEEVSMGDVYSIIGGEICNLVVVSLPECIVWTYTESNILPNKVDIEAFTSDPDTCEPLSNIFYLGGYDDIKKTITDAQSKTNGIRNLLKKLSSNATSHLNSVWPEYKSISINLIENGDYIDMGIEDKFNIYSFSRRSDGFKRFSTFLLLISAKVKADYLSNTIILIDEPDIGLHPTGVQFLRKELEKISKNNVLVVSSHSIFMIDKERIDRHLIVKKEDEITNVTIGSVSDILDEEVLYHALGFSFFDLLKRKNIVFEGWRDKHAFQRWLKSTSVSSATKSEWKDIGMMHALGAKDVARVSSLMEGFGREYFILTDSDKPSLDWKQKFEGDGKWLTYRDLGFDDKETIEDFIESSYIDKMISKVLQNEQINADASFQDCATFNAKVKHLRTTMSLSKDDSSRLGNLIKNQIFEDIPPKFIDLNSLVGAINLSSGDPFINES